MRDRCFQDVWSIQGNPKGPQQSLPRLIHSVSPFFQNDQEWPMECPSWGASQHCSDNRNQLKYWKIIKTDNLSCQICLCTCTKTSTFRYPRKQMAKENRLISTTAQGTCCWVWSQYSKLNLKNDSISKTVCFSFFFSNWFPSVSNGRKSNKCLGIILTHFNLFISTPITKRMVSYRPPEDINFEGSKLSTCTLRPPSARGSHRYQVWERVGCTSHTPASGEPIFATWTRDHQVTLRLLDLGRPSHVSLAFTQNMTPLYKCHEMAKNYMAIIR